MEKNENKKKNRLLRVPEAASSTNLSIPEEINTDYSLERLDAEAEAPIPWPLDVKN